jgi:hypothetical protein
VLLTLYNRLPVITAVCSPGVRLIWRCGLDQQFRRVSHIVIGSSTPSTPSPPSSRFPDYITPSCSPGSLLTRFCSQSSKSFAASLCAPIHQHKTISSGALSIHIILFFHVDSSARLSNAQLLFFTQPPHSSVMFLISYRSCRRKEERSCHHCSYEREAKKEERMPGKGGTVAGCNCFSFCG